MVEVETAPQESFQQWDKSSGLDSEDRPKWPQLLLTEPEEKWGKEVTPLDVCPSSRRKVERGNENDFTDFSSALSPAPFATSLLFTSPTYSSAPSSSTFSTNRRKQISDRRTTRQIEKYDTYQNDFQSGSPGYEPTGNKQSQSTIDSDISDDGEIATAPSLSEGRSHKNSDQYHSPLDCVSTAYSSSVAVGRTESGNGDNIDIVGKNRITTAYPTTKKYPQPIVEGERSQFMSKMLRSIIKRSKKDTDPINVTASKSVSSGESVFSHSQRSGSRGRCKFVSTDQIADQNSSKSWTEMSAQVSQSSSEFENFSIGGKPPDFFALIKACTATSHEEDNFEIHPNSKFPDIEDGMLAAEEDEESIFRTIIQSLTATSHEGRKLEVQMNAGFPKINNNAAIPEFLSIDGGIAKYDGSTSIEDEISKTTKSMEKRSLVRKVTSVDSKSSSNVNDRDMLPFTAFNIDITKELKSRASKLLSLPKSKIDSAGANEGQGNCDSCSEKVDPNRGTANLEASSREKEEETIDIHTLIQSHTAISHEGQNFEIQPKAQFPDIVTDPVHSDEATSIQENLSKTSTASIGKHSLFSKVKSIVSKSSSKYEGDTLTFSISNSEHAKEVESKASTSYSQSKSKSVCVHQCDCRGSYVPNCERIDPKWGTAKSDGSSRKQEEEGSDILNNIIQALTATSHEGQNFEIQRKSESSDVKTDTPNYNAFKDIQAGFSRTSTGSTGKRSLSSKLSSAVSKPRSILEGETLAFSTSKNDSTKEAEAKTSKSISQSYSKSLSFTEHDCRGSYDSRSEKMNSTWGTTNTATSLKRQEEVSVFHSMIQALTSTSYEDENFEKKQYHEFPDTKNNVSNSIVKESNQEELSITPAESSGKSSLSSKFSHELLKSSSKFAGDSFSTSKNDIAKEVESKASTPAKSKSSCFSEFECQESYDPYNDNIDRKWDTANSDEITWEEEEEEESNMFHTMIQSLTATSHEGQIVEIQPNHKFPDIRKDVAGLEEPISIQEEISNNSTSSIGKRSFLSKVKSIVSKPSSKIEGESVAPTVSTDMKVASKLESKVSSSSSESYSSSVSISEYESHDQEDSCDVSSYRIDPNWEVDSSRASTWNELEPTPYQCSLGPECLSTISGESSEEDDDSETTGSADSTVSSISTAS